MDTVDFSVESQVQVAKEEAEKHSLSPKYRRAGPAAGGIELHDGNNECLNPSNIRVTTQRNRIFRHTATSLHAITNYTGKKTGKKTSTWLRGDLPGVPMSKEECRGRLETSKAYREQMLAIFQSRFKCLLIASCLEVHSLLPKGLKRKFPEKLDNGRTAELWKHFDDAYEGFKVYKNKWKGIDHGLTDFQVYLLEYSLQTGELVNHGDVACHVDKSEGHIVETMDLIGNMAPSDTRDPSVIAEELQNKTGQLITPLIDAGFELRPGRDVIHINATQTPHVPDDSRGSGNKSRVKHTRN